VALTAFVAGDICHASLQINTTVRPFPRACDVAVTIISKQRLTAVVVPPSHQDPSWCHALQFKHCEALLTEAVID
jgi:hypothetical protein